MLYQIGTNTTLATIQPFAHRAEVRCSYYSPQLSFAPIVGEKYCPVKGPTERGCFRHRSPAQEAGHPAGLRPTRETPCFANQVGFSWSDGVQLPQGAVLALQTVPVCLRQPPATAGARWVRMAALPATAPLSHARPWRLRVKGAGQRILSKRQRPGRGGQDALTPLTLSAAGTSSGRQERSVSAKRSPARHCPAPALRRMQNVRVTPRGGDTG
jgi:hypothetical protein